MSTQSENVRFVQSKNVLLGLQDGEDIEDGATHEPQGAREVEGDRAGPGGSDESSQGGRGAGSVLTVCCNFLQDLLDRPDMARDS